MQMEPVISSLISHRGYDADKQIMRIRFTSKTFRFGSLYEYGNISPTFYASGCEVPSFGQWFQREVKANDREYPFRKISDPTNEQQADLLEVYPETTDFASGQPIPVEAAEPLIPDTPRIQAARDALAALDARSEGVDTDRMRAESQAELKAAQEEALQAEFDRIKAKLAEVGKVEGNRIIIASAEAAALALAAGNMIARWRDDLEKTMRPEIERLRAPYTAALAIFNRYNNPLKDDQDRLRAAIADYNRLERQREEERNRELRRQQEREAQEAATRRSQELQLDDAIAAEERGEPELAESIISSPALSISPSLAPPVRVASAVPAAVRSAGRTKYAWEMIDLSKLPDEYWIPDTKAIDKLVAAIGERANTSLNGAIRAYDAGTVAFSKKQ